MKKYKILFALVLCMVGLAVYAGPVDSVGTKVKNGKIFIMHKVEKSQGLFAISRIYGVPLDELIKNNPGSDEVLYVDQILLVPTGKDAPFEEKVVKDYFKGDPQPSGKEVKSAEKSTFAKYHKVAKGETLYAISMLYNTKVDVIKSLNNLQSNEIREGIELLVPSSETEKLERNDKIDVAERKADSLAKAIKTAKQSIKTNDQASEEKAKKAVSEGKSYERKVERLAEYDIEKVWEKGFANKMELLEGGKQQRTCSHHEAPVGSTVMVTNPANQKAVFVKVVAQHKLDTAKANIILLSPAAFDYIGILPGQLVETSFAR